MHQPLDKAELNDRQRHDQDKEHDRFCARKTKLEILEGVEQPLILVLDDYHHLGTDTPVHAVLDRVIAYLPDVIQLIIISRDIPPLTLARLRSQNSLAIIDRADLLFTDEETQELFRKVFGLALTPEQLREYGQRTHGWITALQLVRQVAQRQITSGGHDQAPDPLAVLHHSERDIFEYFAEEVFALELPESIRVHVSLLRGVHLRMLPPIASPSPPSIRIDSPVMKPALSLAR